MGVIAENLKLQLTSGSTSSTTNTNPINSIGGQATTTDVDETTTLGNIFDTVTGAESSAGEIEYRWLVVRNASTDSNATAVKVYVSINTGTDGDNASDVNDATSAIALAKFTSKNNPTAVLGTSGYTAPTDASAFAIYDSTSDSLSLDDLNFGEYQCICVRRTIGSSAQANDSAEFTIKIEVDTGA